VQALPTKNSFTSVLITKNCPMTASNSSINIYKFDNVVINPINNTTYQVFPNNYEGEKKNQEYALINT
jgi:hypothetical protein